MISEFLEWNHWKSHEFSAKQMNMTKILNNDFQVKWIFLFFKYIKVTSIDLSISTLFNFS